MSKKMSNLILYNPKEQISMLYDKKITCPVCGNVFKARAIRKNSYRIIKKDSDFFIRYSRISPYFYDVWVCNECGYASIKTDFEKLSDYDADTIKEQLTPKWHKKNFPEVYDIDLAIQRYKLSLLNYYTINSRPSKKAMNYLKLAWMYRLKEDSKNEMNFLIQALDNLNSAYFNESFPMYGMNKFTAMYLIGELMRRTGAGEKSLIWFSQVITSTMASEKLKDLAHQQKNLVNDEATEDSLNEQQEDKKKGLFNKFHI